MRVNIMFGLSHVKDNEADYEAIRLLESFVETLKLNPEPLRAREMFILMDTNGNRVGVMDVIAD